MTLNINDGERYVPEIFGNDKEPEPIAFNLRYLTVKDQDEVEYWESIAVKGSDKIRLKLNYVETFRRAVVSIENCIVNGKAITTADEYLSLRGAKRLTDMMHDVALRIKNASEVDEKN